MSELRVLYITPLYSEGDEGRLARFHDLLTAVDERGEIDYDILNLTTRNSNDEEDNIQRTQSYRSFLRDVYTKSPEYDIVQIVSSGSVVAGWLPTAIVRNSNVAIGPTILGYESVRPGPRYDLREIPWQQRIKYTVDNTMRRVLLSGASPVSRRFEAVYALGEYHKELLENMGVPTRKITIIPPGVNTRVFSPEGDRYETGTDLTLLYVGPYSRHKGYDVFIEALERLPEGLDVHAVVAGDDSPRDVPASLRDDVTFLRYRPRSSLAKLYRGCDLYVQPSHDEVVPTTMVEALACGTPVVATDRLGFSECKRGDNCLLFQRSDPTALADTIEQYAADRARYDESAMAHATAYDIGHAYNSVRESYADMIGS